MSTSRNDSYNEWHLATIRSRTNSLSHSAENPFATQRNQLKLNSLASHHNSPFAGLSPSFFRSLRIAVNRKQVAGTVASVVFVLGCWAVVSGFSSNAPSLRSTCDAFASPGRLLVNLTSPLHSQWRPFDSETCPPLPAYLPALWELAYGPEIPPPASPLSSYSAEYRFIGAESTPPSLPANAKAAYLDPVAFLRRIRRAATPPTILILGDSVDRNGLVHFCQLFKQNVSNSHYHDITLHPPDPLPLDSSKQHGPPFDGWDQRGLPHLCEIPLYSEKGRGRTALRLVNGFMYGMDDLDEFNSPGHSDWHAPGRIEDRIDELVVPMLEQMGGTGAVDLVQLHSGMWDVALFGMQDDKTHWSLTVPLTPEQMAWWQDRMRQTIYHIRSTFPKARIVYRKLHRTDDAVAGTQYITNLRVHQLRHLQEEIARSEGLPIFDFGHVFEGYQLFQEKVHPLLVPGGILYAQNLLHQLSIALGGR